MSDMIKGTMISYRPDIKVLDATIRDGGLVNNFEFTDDFVRKLYLTNVRAGVDVMEIGYLADPELFEESKFGKWKFCHEDAIQKVLGDILNPKMQLAVGTLQTFLDQYLKEHGGEVDYIHGDEVTDELGSKPGNIGFKLPAMGKEQLFKTVMADGVLPRKTFSMGHAQDKRYYVEARKIK